MCYIQFIFANKGHGFMRGFDLDFDVVEVTCQQEKKKLSERISYERKPTSMKLSEKKQSYDEKNDFLNKDHDLGKCRSRSLEKQEVHKSSSILW